MPRNKLLTLSALFCVTLSNCVSVPSTHGCAVAGHLAEGAICKETETSTETDLSLDETIDLLEEHEARDCVPVPGFQVCSDSQIGTQVHLPKRGGAIIIPREDYTKLKTALEDLCREEGPNCSYQIPRILRLKLP